MAGPKGNNVPRGEAAGNIEGRGIFFQLSPMCSLSIKETYSKVSNKLKEAMRRYWKVKITVFYPGFIIVERSGKLPVIVENKTCDVTVGELKKCGKFETVLVSTSQ